MQYAEGQKRVVVWIYLLLLSTLAGLLIPMAGVTLPSLKLEISPPGYPQPGGSWHIVVWELCKDKEGWCKSAGATVVMTTDLGKYYLTTNNEGEITVHYRKEYGKVSFQAFKPEYVSSSSWTPVVSFISVQWGFTYLSFVIPVFGAINLKVIFPYLVSYYRREESRVFRLLAHILMGMTLICAFLHSRWVSKSFEIGLSYGFINEAGIVDLRLLLLSSMIMVFLAAVIKFAFMYSHQSKNHEKD